MPYKYNQCDKSFSDSSVKCCHTYKDSYMVIKTKKRLQTNASYVTRNSQEKQQSY